MLARGKKYTLLSILLVFGAVALGVACSSPGLVSDGFNSVSAGTLHTCGVRANNTVHCWSPQVVNFKDVEELGELGELFGFFEIELSDPPAGEFKTVSAGTLHNCGVRMDDTVECWISGTSNDEEFSNFELLDPPSREFKSVSAGGLHSCGIRADDTVDCWLALMDTSAEDFGAAILFAGINPPSGEFKSVSAGILHSCGVRADNSVDCWGIGDSLGGFLGQGLGQSGPPSGEFKTVGASFIHSCGIRADNTVECWSGGLGDISVDIEGFDELFNMPSGEFTAIDTGIVHNCGIRTDNTIECWGPSEVVGQLDDPPTGEFSAITVGAVHNCAIRMDGTVVCWELKIPDVSGDSTSP